MPLDGHGVTDIGGLAFLNFQPVSVLGIARRRPVDLCLLRRYAAAKDASSMLDGLVEVGREQDSVD